MKQMLDIKRIDMSEKSTAIPDLSAMRSRAEIIDKIKDIVNPKGYWLETTKQEDHCVLVSATEPNRHFWFDDDNKIRCAPSSAHGLQLLGLNPIVAPTPSVSASETDPSGISAHTPGAKLDAGKNRLGLVLQGFAKALEEVGRVGTFGANKYTDNGWMSVPNGHARYTDATYRHLLKEAQGEILDPDSGLQHAAHTAWNALARLELKLREYDNAA